MKINKITKYTLMASVALSLSACSLDYEPVGQYSDATIPQEETKDEGRFESRSDVETYMQSTIRNRYHERQEHWYLDQLLMADCHSDNAYVGTTGAEVVPFEDNSIDGANSDVQRDWERFLADVASCNVLIQDVQRVKDNSLSDEEIVRYTAEARLLRAMIWFDMARMWGDIPLVKTVAGDITAENIEESYQAYFPAQSPELEVYEAIVEDLEYALQYAPKNAGDKSQLTQEVAIAMLAKVYAEKPIRDYSKTIQYADMLAARGYALCADFRDLFGMNDDVTDCRARNTVETIYEAHYTPGAGNWVSWMFGRDILDWDNSYTWAKWVTPSRDIIALFQQQGDEIRYTESVVWRDCTWSNYYPMDNYAFMFKYRSKASNMIKLRYADILLLKAEAYIMGDNQNLEAAATIIDQVRARVNLPKLSAAVRGDREALLKAYMDERRLELAFEGQRWYDLVRLDKVEEVMNAVYAKDPGRKAQRNPYTANSYRLPIPQSAIDQNDNLVQNPGY